MEDNEMFGEITIASFLKWCRFPHGLSHLTTIKQCVNCLLNVSYISSGLPYFTWSAIYWELIKSLSSKVLTPAIKMINLNFFKLRSQTKHLSIFPTYFSNTNNTYIALNIFSGLPLKCWKCMGWTIWLPVKVISLPITIRFLRGIP